MKPSRLQKFTARLPRFLVGLATGFCFIHCFHEQRYLLAFLAVVAGLIFSALMARLCEQPCQHQQEVVVGACGDEEIVARLAISHPARAAISMQREVTRGTYKVRCVVCGRIRLATTDKIITNTVEL